MRLAPERGRGASSSGGMVNEAPPDASVDHGHSEHRHYVESIRRPVTERHVHLRGSATIIVLDELSSSVESIVHGIVVDCRCEPHNRKYDDDVCDESASQEKHEEQKHPRRR